MFRYVKDWQTRLFVLPFLQKREYTEIPDLTALYLPPLTKKLDPRHAVDFIIETVMNSEDNVTLVPTGPLSNIAMAIKKEPRILEKIDEIVLMGGAYQHGNGNSGSRI